MKLIESETMRRLRERYAEQGTRMGHALARYRGAQLRREELEDDMAEADGEYEDAFAESQKVLTALTARAQLEAGVNVGPLRYNASMTHPDECDGECGRHQSHLCRIIRGIEPEGGGQMMYLVRCETDDGDFYAYADELHAFDAAAAQAAFPDLAPYLSGPEGRVICDNTLTIGDGPAHVPAWHGVERPEMPAVRTPPQMAATLDWNPPESTPAGLMDAFQAGARGLADVDLTGLMWRIIRDIQQTYHTAMAEHLVVERIADVEAEVEDYLGNHYGDDSTQETRDARMAAQGCVPDRDGGYIAVDVGSAYLTKSVTVGRLIQLAREFGPDAQGLAAPVDADANPEYARGVIEMLLAAAGLSRDDFEAMLRAVTSENVRPPVDRPRVVVALGRGDIIIGQVDVIEDAPDPRTIEADGDRRDAALRFAAVAWNALTKNGVYKIAGLEFTATECAEWWA